MSMVNIPFEKNGKRWETAPIVGKGGDIRVRVHALHSGYCLLRQSVYGRTLMCHLQQAVGLMQICLRI